MVLDLILLFILDICIEDTFEQLFHLEDKNRERERESTNSSKYERNQFLLDAMFYDLTSDVFICLDLHVEGGSCAAATLEEKKMINK